MIRKTLCSLLLATAVALAPALAAAAEFSDAQKAELGPLIRDYLLKNPEVLREALQELDKRDQEKEKTAQSGALKEHAADIFRHAGDLVAGNPEGKVTMVEFFDYNCGYCKRAYPDVLRMIKDEPDLRLVMKEFPILGPGSLYAARAALASREQGKYWEFHMALLGHEGHHDEASVLAAAKQVGLDIDRLKLDMDKPAVMDTIRRNKDLADILNIQGTPAFIIDDTIIPGAIGYEGLVAAVTVVRDNGCKLC